MQPYQPSSQLGWIDFSDSSRKKMLKVLEALNGKGTIDELGIGSIRNAFSNKLFPATSVLMTRARYYLFIPYILKDFLKDKTATDAKKYLAQQELWLVSQLVKSLDSKQLEGSGIIGYTVYKDYKRLAAQPASVSYWGGIRKLGIYQGESSLANYLEQLNMLKAEQSVLEQNPDAQDGMDDKNDDEDPSLLSIPSEPNWKGSITMDLTENEQNFLIHKINDLPQQSLFSFLLNSDLLDDTLIKTKNLNIRLLETALVEYSKKHHVPPSILKTLHHANRFWELIRGAHFLYNIELHRRSGVEEKTNTAWEIWKEEMKQLDWEKFDKEWFWVTVSEETRIDIHTKFFVDTWFEKAKSGNFNKEELITLIENQERRIKGKRAKLHNIQDHRYTKVQGLTSMEFRFGNIKRLIGDLIKSPPNA